MATANPYAADLGHRDPYEALQDTPQRIRAIADRWSDDRFQRTYAPGKWTAHRIFLHLAQTELALGTRVRYALTETGYTAQAFEQDEWLPLDEGIDGRTALEVYTTLRRMNAMMFRRLTPEQRDRAFRHPEYGELTVGWVAAQMAGHDLHHLAQVQIIDAAP